MLLFCGIGCHLYIRGLILFNCGVYGYHKITDWLLVNPNLPCLRPSKHSIFRSWWSWVYWSVFWHTYSSVFISAVLSLVWWWVHGFVAFRLLVLYSEIVVSNELVIVGVTCGLSEPTVTTFATKTSELQSKASKLQIWSRSSDCLPTLYEYIKEGSLIDHRW
jgi:hypothetical protein